jgi:hypothetical protein
LLDQCRFTDAKSAFRHISVSIVLFGKVDDRFLSQPFRATKAEELTQHRI